MEALAGPCLSPPIAAPMACPEWVIPNREKLSGKSINLLPSYEKWE